MEELLKPAVLEILDHSVIVTCNVSGYNDIYITESRKILLDALAIACAIQHRVKVKLRPVCVLRYSWLRAGRNLQLQRFVRIALYLMIARSDQIKITILDVACFATDFYQF